VQRAARIFPFAVPAASLQKGLLYWGRRQSAKAIASFRHGAEEAGRMGLPYHEARSLLALARVVESRQERERSRGRGLELLQTLHIDPESLSFELLLKPRVQAAT
jgi:hypothetical protein